MPKGVKKPRERSPKARYNLPGINHVHESDFTLSIHLSGTREGPAVSFYFARAGSCEVFIVVRSLFIFLSLLATESDLAYFVESGRVINRL